MSDYLVWIVDQIAGEVFDNLRAADIDLYDDLTELIMKYKGSLSDKYSPEEYLKYMESIKKEEAK